MWPYIPPLIFKITEQTVTTKFLERKQMINILNEKFVNASVVE